MAPLDVHSAPAGRMWRIYMIGGDWATNTQFALNTRSAGTSTTTPACSSQPASGSSLRLFAIGTNNNISKYFVSSTTTISSTHRSIGKFFVSSITTTSSSNSKSWGCVGNYRFNSSRGFKEERVVDPKKRRLSL